MAFNYIPTKKTGKWIKNAMEYRFNILEGVIRAGKDYTTAVAFIERILASDEEAIYMVAGVSANSAWRIVGTYILKYLNGLGRKTKYMESDAIEFTHKGIKSIIVFYGGYNKSSPEQIQGLTLKYVYLTEINLLNQEFIQQAIQRTASYPDAAIFGTLNPKSEKHWFYQEFLFLWSRYQKENVNKKWLNYSKLYLTDNPIFTEEMIEDIKSSYDPNSIRYKRDLLGLRVDAEGMCFNLYDYNVIDKFDIKDYISYIIVADPGESLSATVFLCLALKYNEDKGNYTIDVIKEYYHLNNEHNERDVKMMADYAHDLAVFKKECYDMFDRYSTAVIIDDSAEFFRNIRIEFIKEELDYKSVLKPKKPSDEERINQIQSLLYRGQLRFYKKCSHSISDIQTASIDEKASNIGKIKIKNDYTQEGHQDSLDATVYGIQYYYDKLHRHIKT